MHEYSLYFFYEACFEGYFKAAGILTDSITFVETVLLLSMYEM